MNIKQAIKIVIRTVLYCLPKNKNKLVLESNPDYADNSRAFSDYLLENDKCRKLKIVWCVRQPQKFSSLKNKNLKFTSFTNKKYTLSYIFHIATSKAVLYTHATPPLIDTRVQTVVCLWHGTPLKHMEHTKTKYPIFSYIASASDFCSESLAECFKVPIEQVKIIGYPRCDQLFSNVNILPRLNINKAEYSKVLLWMPTFRQSSQLNIFDTKQTGTGLPLIETKQQLSELNTRLKELNLFLIIKLHPLQDMADIELFLLDHIHMLTSDNLEEKGVQLYHLVSNCDILLTDYSSIYFDYLLLDRPIGFIIDDIAEYEKNRGFVTDKPLDYMPGEKIKTKDELFAFLENMSNNVDNYSEQRKKVNGIVNLYNDNNSSKRLLELLCGIID